jgi:hypothetical protein
MHSMCKGEAPTSDGGWKYFVAWEKGLLGATAPQFPQESPPPFVNSMRSYETRPTSAATSIDGVNRKCCGGNSTASTWDEIVFKAGTEKAGPGAELLKIYREAGVPTCAACVVMAAQMNQWGPATCREKVDIIVEDVFPRAKIWVEENRPFIHALLPGIVEDIGIRRKIRSDILKAITIAESYRAEPSV